MLRGRCEKTKSAHFLERLYYESRNSFLSAMIQCFIECCNNNSTYQVCDEAFTMAHS